MRLRVVDFETTGAQGSEVIEAGFVDVELVEGEWRVAPPVTKLFRPKGSVTVQARAVHHISDAELAPAEPSAVEAVARFLSQGMRADAFVAHHAEFEKSFLPSLRSASWICTAKAARRAWPLAPGYSNQVLRYWLDLKLDPALALPAHRAGPDAYVTAHILLRLLRTMTSNTLIDWTTQPSVVSFGRHKGQPWSEVPSGYLQWITSESDMADRHRQRAQDELKRREASDLVEVAQ